MLDLGEMMLSLITSFSLKRKEIVRVFFFFSAKKKVSVLEKQRNIILAAT